MLDTFKLAMSINTKRRWIPACAGMTVVIEATVKFSPSSPARDDCCLGGSNAIRIPHSLPAQGVAGVFMQHAACPQNGTGLQASARPARGDPAPFVT
jgi:hypothetical protein